MPNSRLASLGGYGVVLNVPNNPYASAAENYINSFINSSTKLYGGFDERGRYTVGVIVQNIAKNEKIIEQQKAVYKAIEKTLPTGMTMSDLLAGKYVQNRQARSNSMKLYNKASTKDIKATSEQLSQARKRVERRTNIFHKNFQKAIDILLEAVKGYQEGITHKEDVVKSIEEAKKKATTLITEGFIDAYKNIIADGTYFSEIMNLLTRIQNTKTGIKEAFQVRETSEGFEITTQGLKPETIDKFSQISRVLYELTRLDRKLQEEGGYKTKRDKSGSTSINRLRYLSHNINYLNADGTTNKTKELLFQIQQKIKQLEDLTLQTVGLTRATATKRQRRQMGHTVAENIANIELHIKGNSEKKLLSVATMSPEKRESVEGEAIEYLVDHRYWTLSKAPKGTAYKALRTGQAETFAIATATGKDPKRTILKYTNRKVGKGALTKQISDIGSILKSIEENAQKMADAATVAGEATEKVQSRIDSITDLAKTKYYIAFSDKFYNPSTISSAAISGGSIYTNLTSIDSSFIPGSKINNKVLYLLLLNLANVAWYYQHDSDNTREKIRQSIQQLIMQNFLSLSFGPENLMEGYKIDKKDVLYVHHITGAIIPVYTTLEVINRYLTKFVEGQGDQLSNRSPIKVNIKYSDGHTGMGLWKESLEKFPGEKGNDPNKDARWQYVASWVAKDTSIELKYNLIAFDALYQGFYS